MLDWYHDKENTMTIEHARGSGDRAHQSEESDWTRITRPTIRERRQQEDQGQFSCSLPDQNKGFLPCAWRNHNHHHDHTAVQLPCSFLCQIEPIISPHWYHDIEETMTIEHARGSGDRAHQSKESDWTRITRPTIRERRQQEDQGQFSCSLPDQNKGFLPCAWRNHNHHHDHTAVQLPCSFLCQIEPIISPDWYHDIEETMTIEHARGSGDRAHQSKESDWTRITRPTIRERRQQEDQGQFSCSLPDQNKGFLPCAWRNHNHHHDHTAVQLPCSFLCQIEPIISPDWYHDIEETMTIEHARGSGDRAHQSKESDWTRITRPTIRERRQQEDQGQFSCSLPDQNKGFLPCAWRNHNHHHDHTAVQLPCSFLCQIEPIISPDWYHDIEETMTIEHARGSGDRAHQSKESDWTRITRPTI